MIKLKSGRQEIVSAILEVSATDPVAYGTAEDAFDVPANAILVGGDLTVLTPWDSGTTATFKLGDAADDDRYTAAAIDLKTAGRTALTLTGYKHTVNELLKALFAQTGTDATVGQCRIRIDYVVQGRAAFSQGLDSRGPGLPGA
ncbi:hypothetical protein [Solimonas marina]|uniref:Uncharacterized protein n=1 Tax=Solimonas marina TaxID=2714601 RepID=A0A970B7U1_9GAMM|nr:hypothetical protein [Solimonas marina]NKF21579.1 hypothetical protein [Solimonas marina]